MQSDCRREPRTQRARNRIAPVSRGPSFRFIQVSDFAPRSCPDRVCRGVSLMRRSRGGSKRTRRLKKVGSGTKRVSALQLWDPPARGGKWQRNTSLKCRFGIIIAEMLLHSRRSADARLCGALPPRLGAVAGLVWPQKLPMPSGCASTATTPRYTRPQSCASSKPTTKYAARLQIWLRHASAAAHSDMTPAPGAASPACSDALSGCMHPDNERSCGHASTTAISFFTSMNDVQRRQCSKQWRNLDREACTMTCTAFHRPITCRRSTCQGFILESTQLIRRGDIAPRTRSCSVILFSLAAAQARSKVRNRALSQRMSCDSARQSSSTERQRRRAQLRTAATTAAWDGELQGAKLSGMPDGS